MPVSYNKLWKLLIDRGINRTQLKIRSGVSFNVMARMGKNEAVSFDSIKRYVLLLSAMSVILWI